MAFRDVRIVKREGCRFGEQWASHLGYISSVDAWNDWGNRQVGVMWKRIQDCQLISSTLLGIVWLANEEAERGAISSFGYDYLSIAETRLL